MKTYMFPKETIPFNTVVALGDFDGVHIAHRQLIEKTVEIAEKISATSVVYTFDESIKNAPHITDKKQKEAIFKELGIKSVVYQKTSKEFFDTSCEDFVKDILFKGLNAKCVVAGENYTFGKKGLGDADLLITLCEKYNIEVKILPTLRADNKVVSSTLVRELLKEGKIIQADSLLTCPFSLSGIVEKGNQLGESIGFKTANIYPKDNMLLPKYGVYKADVILENKKYKGIVNIGVKPTVEKSRLSVEAHIIGIDKDLYGQNITIFPNEFIREEKKFSSLEELKKQIEKDIKM